MSRQPKTTTTFGDDPRGKYAGLLIEAAADLPGVAGATSIRVIAEQIKFEAGGESTLTVETYQNYLSAQTVPSQANHDVLVKVLKRGDAGKRLEKQINAAYKNIKDKRSSGKPAESSAPSTQSALPAVRPARVSPGGLDVELTRNALRELKGPVLLALHDFSVFLSAAVDYYCPDKWQGDQFVPDARSLDTGVPYPPRFDPENFDRFDEQLELYANFVPGIPSLLHRVPQLMPLIKTVRQHNVEFDSLIFPWSANAKIHVLLVRSGIPVEGPQAMDGEELGVKPKFGSAFLERIQELSSRFPFESIGDLLKDRAYLAELRRLQSEAYRQAKSALPVRDSMEREFWRDLRVFGLGED